MVLVTVKMSAKLFVEKFPLPSPGVTCKALVLPLPIVHVTSRLAPVLMTLVIRNVDAVFVGLVPARYSCRLDMPSPPGSPVAQEPGTFVVVPFPPKYSCRHQLGMPSPTLSRLGLAETRRYANHVPPPPVCRAVRG